ncbi:MAG: Imm27 family immunity protein [Gemmatales bacterium]
MMEYSGALKEDVWENLQNMFADLLPNEIELRGSWIVEGDRVVGDASCKRIEWLAELRLERLGTDPSGWAVLFRDTGDNRLWELTYPESELHGSGPPKLPKLKMIADAEARVKYCLKPSIRATLTFLSQEQGGRVHPPGLLTGQYMPHIVVQSSDVRSVKTVNGVCVEKYLGVRILSTSVEVVPLAPFQCSMELMYHPHVDYSAVQETATFTVREGGKVIGYGAVLSRSG